jgi:hypothetical protein
MVKLPDDRNPDLQPDTGPPFPASFESRCAWCDEQIYEGDTIRMVDGQAMHEQCEEDSR